MNIEQAKTIPLSVILDKINYKPAKKTRTEEWYLSPFRQERTPSFHLNTKKNIWFDFGESVGGDNLDFVCHYLKSVNVSHNISDALRWIRNMTGNVPSIATVATVDETPEDKKLILRGKKEIEHPGLVQYLQNRGIPLPVGKEYLKEVRVFNQNSRKTMFALGMRNEDAGYELRNPFFKGCLGSKSVTFIRGTRAKPEGVNIFEGFMDFLSIVASQKGKKFEDDTIILNSLSCLKKASGYIQNYGYKVGYTWMDNDAAGQKANQALADYFKTQASMEFTPMNMMYEPHKDVNAWYMNKLGLKE
jgi:hypothetical protein